MITDMTSFSVVSHSPTDVRDANVVLHEETCEAQREKRSRRRLFVEHRYHDHAYETELPRANIPDHSLKFQGAGCVNVEKRKQGGWSVTFPEKLHAMLEDVDRAGLEWIVSWQPHGRAFLVHHREEFVNNVMPKYFNQTRLTSFHRQLNLYGFLRITRGADAGAYYHELFLRGKSFLCKRIQRFGVKGTGVKASSSPATEPDFYKMPPLLKPSDHLSLGGRVGNLYSSNVMEKPSMVRYSSGREMSQQQTVLDAPETVTVSPVTLVQAYGSTYSPPNLCFENQDFTGENSVSTSRDGVVLGVNTLCEGQDTCNESESHSTLEYFDKEEESIAHDGKACPETLPETLDPLSLLLRHAFGDGTNDDVDDEEAHILTTARNGFHPVLPPCGAGSLQQNLDNLLNIPAQTGKPKDLDESSKMSDSELGNLLEIICDEL